MFSVVLSTFPVIILGALSYTKATREIEEKVAKENMQVLQQTKISLEYHLETLDNNVTQFILSPFFTSSYERKLTPKDFITYRDLSAAMKRFQTDKIWNDEVELINFKENWAISKRGLEYPNEVRIFNKYSSVKKIPKASVWMTISDQNIESVNLVKKLPLLANKPEGLIRISISKREINKLINGDNDIENFFIMDGNDQLISEPTHRNQFLTSEKFIQELNSKKSDNGYFMIKMDEENIGVNYSKSSYNEWTYLSIVPIGTITKDSRDIGWYTAFVCIVMIIILIIVASLFSKYFYHPIRLIYQSVATSVEGKKALNSKDEFKSIQSKIDQFQYQIDNQTKHLREFFIIGLCMGQIKIEKINEMVQNLNLDTDWEALSVLVIQPNVLGSLSTKNGECELFLHSINTLVSESLSEELRYPPIILDEYQVTIIQMYDKNRDNDREYLYGLAEELKRLVLEYLNLSISIGISRPFTRLANTELAYNEATKALKYHQRLESGMIVSIDDIVLDDSVKNIFPKQIYQELIQSIKEVQPDDIEESISKLMTEIRKNCRSFLQYQNILMQLLSKLLELVQELGISSEKLFGEKVLFEEILKFKDIDEIECWITKTVLPPIIEKYADKQKDTQSNITESVISIIEKEFYSDLTLDIIASKINFHPSYISRVFKKETGYSFSEYLLDYRIKKMKKMLRETNLKIAEIAEIFHFNSSAAFIRSFRKVEGITPGQYRKKYHL
ncbi:AraC family transcriptional regulator [Lederbergia galactosidilytica]|uniref:HTH araC/xylS-type domain-containing protein n=1 Tax=Lederbergia galactosidilytica TaxID=217031 RepID=A0A178A2M5_9BACI|nr:AraC family transcriptional regulator [Lederbergia galactosidilytica]OAK74173.1 hypothetical protein ABB05_04590 [Lederbergia galactosidilytica]